MRPRGINFASEKSSVRGPVEYLGVRRRTHTPAGGAENRPLELDPVSAGVRKIRTMKKLVIRGATALCMATLPAAASAAAASADGEPKDSVTDLRGVEITANRAGDKTPVAFTNVSRKEIARGNDGEIEGAAFRAERCLDLAVAGVLPDQAEAAAVFSEDVAQFRGEKQVGVDRRAGDAEPGEVVVGDDVLAMAQGLQGIDRFAAQAGAAGRDGL